MRGSEADRLYDKIQMEPNSGCWIWTGGINASGYGVFRSSRQYLAHRASYELHCEEIPEGKQLDHLCRTRCCVNPDHLEAVDPIENYRRGHAKYVQLNKTHCPSGHAYSEENVYRSRDGKRICRECGRIRRRLQNKRRTEARLRAGEWVRGYGPKR